MSKSVAPVQVTESSNDVKKKAMTPEREEELVGVHAACKIMCDQMLRATQFYQKTLTEAEEALREAQAILGEDGGESTS